MTADTVPCNYCGVDDATEVFGPGVAQPSRIVRCNRCGLMYASPRARAVDAVLIQDWKLDRAFLHKAGAQRFEKERLQVRDFARTRKLLDHEYPARGKLLEIGSGLGFLLAELKKDGWDVLGIEPNLTLADHAREELGVETRSELLHQAGIPDETFDVVIMNHVIEHVDEPLATLREINRVLKPNGHLVLETPRYDTLMFRLLGRRERSLNCEGHIYFFTTQTLKNFYQAAGFETRQLNYVGRSLTLDRFLWNVGVVSKSERFRKAMAATSRRLKLDKLHLYLNFRDMQRVCVRKVRSFRAMESPAAQAEAATPA